MSKNKIIVIPFNEMKSVFKKVMLKNAYSPSDAELCSRIITESTCDGVISHGIGRFHSQINKVQKGIINVKAVPETVSESGSREVWDGKSGIGIVNATKATERAVFLARQYGIGLIALRNTTHWLRGGSYGWQAAEQNCALIAWTNTIPNMPPWQMKEPLIGNNPLVIAVPREKGPMVLDMAMSQYSYGKLNEYDHAGKEMGTIAGFDINGKETKKPGEVLKSGRPVPTGFWKGSGLAMVLDLLAAGLALGDPTANVRPEENNICQIFLAISLDGNYKNWIDQISTQVLNNPSGGTLRYPGERVLEDRERNRKNGIPIPEKLWKIALSLI